MKPTWYLENSHINLALVKCTSLSIESKSLRLECKAKELYINITVL